MTKCPAIAAFGKTGCVLLWVLLFSIGAWATTPAERAMGDLQRRASTGDAVALDELGWAYAKGEVIKRDDAKAFACFREAAEAGDPAGMLVTAERYRTGLGVPLNTERAGEWSRKALAAFETRAQSGDVHAMVALSAIYFRGNGAAPDVSRAALWAVKAAEKVDVKGMTLAALLLASSPDKEKQQQALRWALTAADAGEPAAMFLAGAIYDGGLAGQRDEAKARRWYRKSADAGNIDAMILMVFKSDVDKDDVEAFQWLTKAAEARNVWAISELGVRYLKGRGVAKDDTRAEKLIRVAAYFGDARGMSNLGLAYATGRGGVEPDDEEAVRWYRKAADFGNVSAINNLGFMYANGRGVAADPQQAVELYRKAADLGNADAMLNLSHAYHDGDGVPKDEVEAAMWLERSKKPFASNAKPGGLR